MEGLRDGGREGLRDGEREGPGDLEMRERIPGINFSPTLSANRFSSMPTRYPFSSVPSPRKATSRPISAAAIQIKSRMVVVIPVAMT